MSDLKAWNLVADIGGTNARFAIQDLQSNELKNVIVLSVADHPTFLAALQHVLAHIQKLGEWKPLPQATCLALACPVDQETIDLTNSHWIFTRSQLSEALQQHPVHIINDFSAVAYSIPALKPFEWHQIGGHKPQPNAPIAILGPGTGLGVSTLLNDQDGIRVIEGEGGHIDFAAVNSREIDVFNELRKRFERVSVERLLSGAGIVNIYLALCDLEGANPDYHSEQEITRAAINAENYLAVEALSMFCQVLGSTAGNQALLTGARGGVYIAGGIAPRFIDFIENSDLRTRFEDKGRFRDYVKDIPIRIIVKQHLGLFGAMQKLNAL